MLTYAQICSQKLSFLGLGRDLESPNSPPYQMSTHVASICIQHIYSGCIIFCDFHLLSADATKKYHFQYYCYVENSSKSKVVTDANWRQQHQQEKHLHRKRSFVWIIVFLRFLEYFCWPKKQTWPIITKNVMFTKNTDWIESTESFWPLRPF